MRRWPTFASVEAVSGLVYSRFMLRVLGRASSINVRKVLWTAAEAEVAFTHEGEWGAERGLQDPEFAALNPNRQIPVLVTDAGPLWESNTICRFLARSAGRADLLPQEPLAAAEVEAWMDWQATELNSAWRPAFMALVRHQPVEASAVAASVEAWNALMIRLELRLSDTGGFVTGGTFTLADLVLGLSLQRWLLTPIPRPATPALLSYRERLQARPAAQAWNDPGTP